MTSCHPLSPCSTYCDDRVLKRAGACGPASCRPQCRPPPSAELQHRTTRTVHRLLHRCGSARTDDHIHSGGRRLRPGTARATQPGLVRRTYRPLPSAGLPGAHAGATPPQQWCFAAAAAPPYLPHRGKRGLRVHGMRSQSQATIASRSCRHSRQPQHHTDVRESIADCGTSLCV